MIAAARALERAGRRDAAQEALLAAWRDASAREELARHPAWTHPLGDAGRTRSIDAAVPLKKPGPMWTRELRGAYSLLAGAAGVVVDAQQETLLLDPNDGQEVARFPGRALALAGDEVVVRAPDGALTWHAPHGTGPTRTVQPGGGLDPIAVAGDLVLIVGTARRGVTALRLLPEAGAERLWNRTHDGEHLSLVLRGSTVMGRFFGNGLTELDAFTGRVLRELPGSVVLGDEAGVVTFDPARGQLACVGRTSWERPAPGPPEVLGADVVLVRLPDHGLATVDRTDGSQRPTPSIAPGGAGFGCLLARDLLVSWQVHTGDVEEIEPLPELSVRTLGGELLWSLASDLFGLEELVRRVAPFAGRLFVLTEAGRVMCLED